MIKILRILLVAALFAMNVSVSHAQEFPSPLSPQFPDGSQRAFPTAEGYGAKAFGGRGGRVIHVTNRSDSGPGSLRDALEVQTGPRTVVFDVGGIIDLSNNIINGRGHGYVTVAGQTAPGGGVCLRGGNITIKGNDVIVRHLCIRRGDGPGSPRFVGDGLSLNHATHSIVDHLSISWTIDEALQTWNSDTENVTIQYSLFYEPLDGIICCNEPNHGYGPLIGGGHRISFHHNIVAHARRRSPRISNAQDVDVINNIIYNWRQVGTHVANNDTERPPNRRINVLNNVYRRGYDTEGPALQIDNIDADGQVFFGGNEDYLGNPITDVDDKRGRSDPNALISSQNPRPDDVSVTAQTAEQVWKTLLDNVGARVPVLDQVDSLAIEHIRTGDGTLVECVDKENQQDSLLIDPCSIESALGFFPTYQNVSRPTDFDTDEDGMPDDWEMAHGLNPYHAADRNEDMIGDGWTNLEYYLNTLAGDYGRTTDPATGPTYTVPKTAVAPIIDGDNSEYVDAPAISLTNSRGNVSTYKLLYDDVALYISASVTDEQLNAIAKEDGRLWKDDSIEIFLDTLHDGGTSRDGTDYKFFVNILNTVRDSQGRRKTWDGVWASLAIVDGFVNDNTYSDFGYTLEISIPWSTIGIVPMPGQVIGFDLVMNDRDATGTREYVAWANLNGGSLNDPDGWGDLVLGEELDTGTDGDTGSDSGGGDGSTGGTPDSTPPQVTLTLVIRSPERLTIVADATDDVGLSHAKFYIDGRLEVTLLGDSPYSHDWALLDSSTHDIAVQVFDRAGNVGTAEVRVRPSVEIIVDNLDPNTVLTGTWSQSSGPNPWEPNSVYNNGGSTFRWLPAVPEAGVYEVYAWWTYHSNRSTTVPYRIGHAGGVDTVVVNQHGTALGGQWNLLGSYTFDAGSGGYVEVSSENGQASADAVRLWRR